MSAQVEVEFSSTAGASCSEFFGSYSEAKRRVGELRFDASVVSVKLLVDGAVKETLKGGGAKKASSSGGAKRSSADAAAGGGAGGSKRIKAPPQSASLYQSEQPEACKGGVPVMLGVDEAGRGPVLGPMVYGAAFWPVSDDAELSAKGFDDSKQLTEAQRDDLFDAVMAHSRQVGWCVRMLHAVEIGEGMLRRSPHSLNAMAHDATVEMIRAVVAQGNHVTECFIDTVGDPEYYENWLTQRFNRQITFTVRKKADSIYRVVSAASIVAKCTRDASLHQWVWEEPGAREPTKEFGCGYPGDEKTKAWLRQHCTPVFGFPSLVRFSWQTTKTLMDELCVPVEWEAAADDEAAGTAKLTSMFAGGKAVRKRCPYFEKRGLRHVADFM